MPPCWAIAFAERWVRTVRHELLDRTLIWNQRQRGRLLDEFVEHHNQHRPHRNLNQRAPTDNTDASVIQLSRTDDFSAPSGVTEDLYLAEQKRIGDELERLEDELPQDESTERDRAAESSETLVHTVASLDLETAWEAASTYERRILVDELVENVTVGPEWFSVTLYGSPPVRTRYGEVGLKDSDPVGVGGATHTPSTWNPWTGSYHAVAA